MASTHLVQRIEDDDFALDTIQGKRVLVTCPSILGEKGSDWEGAAIFGRDYLVELLALGLAYRVLNFADVKIAMLKAGEHVATQRA
ncbi:hypothetical protein KIF53_11565 [Chromobacterium subtsugae]|uniref:Uncharacterized protein n=1 Tax=Chromobacterium subtsugae TaxID=251747 RepID=A0ABS7FG38_9NEIS|nr:MULTISPECIES: hypothetical protein [Chromobacterium]RBH45691.1 hypothetical protein C3F00_037550 [Pseudomonas sp. MWU13-2860]KUM04765.1 hypothetical protein Cv017_12665 [Chromobacterium subtsugae]KZE87432.1 hypothetical protein AWB61_11190 [Chromobacterium sp. F49]MBW7566577.1 hypothetical protein [Chromobacterium subtsugae]MBW8288264.1 hypothetical protein [Chromobacterium subtsugae]